MDIDSRPLAAVKDKWDALWGIGGPGLQPGKVPSPQPGKTVPPKPGEVPSPQSGKAVLPSILGSRAVALVVHTKNKCRPLSPDELRAVFGGTLKDWRDVRGGKSAEIRCFGVATAQPAARLFHGQLISAGRCRGLTRKADTAAVISAVSMDPNAIGFVNYY